MTRALIRYLHEGGFLVALPFGTWPLLYDDSRKGIPYGITDTLSMGVDNGFDQPPGGMELMLQAKTNVLFGLPAVAPFPGRATSALCQRGAAEFPQSTFTCRWFN